MGENIFTTQEPAGDNFSDGPLTLSTLFQASVAGQVNGIRWRAAAQGETGRRAGLFRRDSESSGALLASVDFVTALDNTWNYTAFSSPVAVTAGQKYYAAIYVPKFYVATGGFFNGTSVTNGHLTAPADDTGTPVRNGRFHAGGSDLTFPDGEFNGGCYFVDVDFTASGVTVAIGQATETDTAQPVTRLKTYYLGQAAEVDTAQPIGRLKTRLLGQAAESDTAQPVGRLKARTIGQAAEVDTVTAVGRAKARTLGQATETDLAQPLVTSARSFGISAGPPQSKWRTGPPAAKWTASPPQS